MALSYCWGTGRFVTTTDNTIEERKSGIRLSYLPNTLKEAILITRSLGVRYIWVDALCIIQKNEEDWNIESAKMATIYEQAYLTIAASSSSSCGKSFLRKKSIYREETLIINCLDDSGRGTIVKARPMLRTGLHDWSGKDRDPCDMRAWTLQEKLLSTRLVSYSGDEIQWSCKTLTTCQCEAELLRSWSGYPRSLFRLEGDTDAYKFWQLQVMNLQSG